MNLHIHFVQMFVAMLDAELPPKIIPQVIMEEMYEKYIILKVSWDYTDLTDLIAKQAEFNFDILINIVFP